MRVPALRSAIPPTVLEASAELEQPTDTAPPKRARPAPRAPSKAKSVEREPSPYPPPESLPPVPTEPARVTAPPPLQPVRAAVRRAEPPPVKPAPVAPRARDEGWSDIDIAYGVAGGGLFVAAGAATWSVDDPDPGVLAVGGVGLGIAVVGLTTAGVLTLVEDDEAEARVTVRATGNGASMTIEY